MRVFVTRLLENRGWMDEPAMQVFYAAGYTPENVLDVLVGIAQKTLSNFTNHIAQTPLDEAFKAYAWEPEKGSAVSG